MTDHSKENCAFYQHCVGLKVRGFFFGFFKFKKNILLLKSEFTPQKGQL